MWHWSNRESRYSVRRVSEEEHSVPFSCPLQLLQVNSQRCGRDQTTVFLLCANRAKEVSKLILSCLATNKISWTPAALTLMLIPWCVGRCLSRAMVTSSVIIAGWRRKKATIRFSFDCLRKDASRRLLSLFMVLNFSFQFKSSGIYIIKEFYFTIIYCDINA